MIYLERKSLNLFRIYHNNIKISKSDALNFSSNNTLKKHVSPVSNKISRNIYIQKLTIYLTFFIHILKLIYWSLIQSKLVNGLLLCDNNWIEIRVIQNNKLRIKSLSSVVSIFINAPSSIHIYHLLVFLHFLL